jgi:hypothetical protein
VTIVFDEVEGVVESGVEQGQPRAAVPVAALETPAEQAQQLARIVCEFERVQRRKARLRAD